MEAEEEEDDYLGKRIKPWPSSSSSSTSLLRLSKKVAIAGAAITSAPVVIPPLLFFSALGVAFAFPFGVYFASFVYTDKLMRSLLPPPHDIIAIGIGGDQENDIEEMEEEIDEVEPPPPPTVDEEEGKEADHGRAVGVDDIVVPSASGAYLAADLEGKMIHVEAAEESEWMRLEAEAEAQAEEKGKDGPLATDGRVVPSVPVSLANYLVADTEVKEIDFEAVEDARPMRVEMDTQGRQGQEALPMREAEEEGKQLGEGLVDRVAFAVPMSVAYAEEKKNDLETEEEEGLGGEEEGKEVGIEMWPPTVDESLVSKGDSIVPSISSGVGEEEDKHGETEERMGAMREEEEERVMLVEGEGEEEEKKGGRNEGKEVENEMLSPNIVIPLTPNAEVEENAIEPKTEHESSIKVGGEVVRLQDEEAKFDPVPSEAGEEEGKQEEITGEVEASSRGCEDEGVVEIEAEEQPMEGLEMVKEEVEEKVEKIHGIVGGESRLSTDVSCSVDIKGDDEVVDVIIEAKPSEADIEKGGGDGYVIENDGNDKEITHTETMEEEKQQSKKQNQDIEFPQNVHLLATMVSVECKPAVEESMVKQNSYEKRVETVLLTETSEITGEMVMRDEGKEENAETADEQSMLEPNGTERRVETVVLTETTEIAEQRVLGDEANEEDGGRPDAEELMTISHSWGRPVTSSGSANEIEPCTMSSEYASAIEDQLSEITDAESGNIAAVETVHLVHSDNEGFDSEERIWEQIYALRTIVGYKASQHSSLGDELRALYLFTGVEPPVSLKETSDLAEVSDKLRFLKAVIGVK